MDMCRRSLALFLMAAAAGQAGFAAGSLELVSQVAPSLVSGTGAGGTYDHSTLDLFAPSLSDDGRYVVFHSYETDLVPGERDLNQGSDVYVQDLLTGSTTLVSHAADSPVTAANAESSWAVISGDGRWIAFTSQATDLVPGQQGPPAPSYTNGALYLYDRAADVTTLVTDNSARDFYILTSSGDARYVAFISRAKNLVPRQQDQPGADYNVFLYDREARSFQLVSHASASPTTSGNGLSASPVFSGDGRWVAFGSNADNLAPGKPPGFASFLYDRVSGTVTLVGPAGIALSTDGRYLAVGGPPDGYTYLYDRVTGTKTLLAKIPDGSADEGAFSLSADGRYVALTSSPGHLIPPQPGGTSAPGLFLYDRVAGTFTLVSRKLGAAGAPGRASEISISGDGRLILFHSREPDLVPGQANPHNTVESLFLFDRNSGKTSLVSHAGASAATVADDYSYEAVISADGSRVVFYSLADDLATGSPDSIAPEAASFGSALSGDGRWIVFGSNAGHLIAGQSGGLGFSNVFLHDRATGATTLASHAAGSLTRTANGTSYALAVTPDGRWLLFTSDATDLIAGTAFSGKEFNDFLYDRLTGAVVLAGPTYLESFANPGPQGGITPDGRWVVFTRSQAPLVPGHGPDQGDRDIYLWDRLTRSTTLVSHTAAGPTATSGVKSYAPRISDDGRWVAFVSLADGLVPGATDGNGLPDLFLWDRTTGRTVLVSHAKGSPARRPGSTLRARPRSIPRASSPAPRPPP
ncbi:MAG: hypothetical protein DMF53_08905 [Acidobacteria bacterium]|nr:MAG: hypothetical protein DMF53_08905 [Acidobacteriota bacterium]